MRITLAKLKGFILNFPLGLKRVGAKVYLARGVVAFAVGSFLTVKRVYAIDRPGGFTLVKDIEDVIEMTCAVADWMQLFFLAFAVIFSLVAAYQYMTSGGDAEKVKKASKTLTYVAVAVGVVLIAYAFPTIILSMFIDQNVTAAAC